MTAGQGQTVLDVAVERCGGVEAAWDIAAGSNVGLTASVGGVSLTVPSVPKDRGVVNALAAAGAKPACDGNPAVYTKKSIGQSIIGTDRIW